MQFVRPVFAAHPRHFGRGQARVLALPLETKPGISEDLKLFAATFVAGFVFVSILIG